MTKKWVKAANNTTVQKLTSLNGNAAFKNRTRQQYPDIKIYTVSFNGLISIYFPALTCSSQ